MAPVLLVIVAAVLPFAATIGYGFTSDDHLILRHIDRAAADGGLLGVLGAPFLPSPDVPNNYYRPVVYLGYWADRALGGGLAHVAHVNNVLLHAAATLLVFVLARSLFHDGLSALAAGLVFATHPVHVESVAWVAGRTDVLCALFSLGATLAWNRARRLGPSRGQGAALASCGLLFALASLSKEAALALPLLLLVLSVPAAGGRVEARQPLGELARAWTLAFVPAALAVLAIRYAALHDELGQVPLAEQISGSLLVSEPAIAAASLLRMLRALLVPWPHSAILTRSEVGFDGITLVAVLALAVLAAWTTFRCNRRAGFVAAALIAGFALPSVLVASGGVVVAAERYAYLPSIGASILLGALAGRVGRLRGVTPAIRVIAVGIITSGLAAASFDRARVWANDDTLSLDVVRTSPQSPLAHQIRAEVLMAQGRLDGAIRSYEQATSLDRTSAPLLDTLGRALIRAGDPAGAARAFQRAIDIEPDWADPHIGLAVACATTGDWTCVAAQRAALRSSPRDLAMLDRILGRAAP